MGKTSTKKNYIRGSARQVTFSDGGSVVNIDLNLEDINSLPVSDSGYVRITLAQRQSADQYGNTHYVYENTFVPDKTKGKGASAPAAPTKPTVGFKKAGNSGVPF